MKLTYVILEMGIVLSKRKFIDWKAVQDQFYSGYKTNLDFESLDQLLAYFIQDYGDKNFWPIQYDELIRFYESSQVDLYVGIVPSNSMSILEVYEKVKTLVIEELIAKFNQHIEENKGGDYFGEPASEAVITECEPGSKELNFAKIINKWFYSNNEYTEINKEKNFEYKRDDQIFYKIANLSFSFSNSMQTVNLTWIYASRYGMVFKYKIIIKDGEVILVNDCIVARI